MKSVSLALSGGGAAGLGHIPVLEALDAHQVRPIAIAGTSMGALIGAAYAAGMSGSDLRAHVVALHQNPLPAARRYFGAARFSLTNMFKSMDPREALAAIWPEDFPDRFEDLAIPLTVVATDFHARKELRFTKGPLREALAASIAIPGVFRPVKIDGRYCIDGGVTNNLPLDALPPCDVTIGVDVASLPEDGMQEEPSALATTTGAMRIMMRALLEQRLESHPPDIFIEPESRVYGALDFAKLPEILADAAPAREATLAGLKACGL